jgi:hypothetical protein
LALLVSATLAFAGFWGIGHVIGFPEFRGHNASLLIQPLPAATVLAVMLGVVLFTAIGSLLSGRLRYDAGWGVTVLGLYALRLRGGPIATTIADRPPTVFITLLMELAVLTAILGIAWGILHTLRERGSAFPSLRRFLELPEATTRLADRKAAAETLDQKMLALALTTATMAVFMMILCRTGNRAQVFFAVGISAYLAVWIAHSFIPTRPAAWFWGGVALCGAVGYAWASFASSPAELAIGQPGGFLAPLARPLPMDYASIGVAAALWRYVQSRTHQLHRVIEAQQQQHQKQGTPATA